MSGSHPLLATLHAAIVSLQATPGPVKDGDMRLSQLCEAVENVLQHELKVRGGIFSDAKGAVVLSLAHVASKRHPGRLLGVSERSPI